MAAKVCDNKSVGQIVMRGNDILIIERKNYPEAFALPAGHMDADTDWQKAATRECEEEAGVNVVGNRRVFSEIIDNPCKRNGGNHHEWKVFAADHFEGEPAAGSDAKAYRWATPEELDKMARRTEYFIKKYDIPGTQVGKLTVAIFGADPALKQTDPESEMVPSS